MTIGIYKNYTPYNVGLKNKTKSLTFQGKYPIRDLNTDTFDRLQKSKVELIIKVREISAMKRELENKLSQAMKFAFPQNLKIKISQELKDAQEYESQVRDKLHKVNLDILTEEEKNY